MIIAGSCIAHLSFLITARHFKIRVEEVLAAVLLDVALSKDEGAVAFSLGVALALAVFDMAHIL